MGQIGVSKARHIRYTHVGGHACGQLNDMSLHFQIDIAFDLRDSVSTDLINGLRNVIENRPLTGEQKKLIPNILKYFSSIETINAFYGRSVLYFDSHYRYTRDGIDIAKWTLHIRQVINDDLFYEEGYPLIAWLATISETEGFVGYLKEELEQIPRQINFQNQIVTMCDRIRDDIIFKLDDFDSKLIKWRD